MPLKLFTDPALRRKLYKGLSLGLAALLVGSLLVVYTYRIALGIIQPPRKLAALKEETAARQQEVHRKERNKAALKAKLDWWSTPEGQIELAHSRGLTRPGEYSVITIPPKAQETSAAGPPAPARRRPLLPVLGGAAAMLAGLLVALRLRQGKAGVSAGLRRRAELTGRRWWQPKR